MAHDPPDRVAEFLMGLAGRRPIETHLSQVFVGEDTVWKRKKAVCLPFIDLRTLAARRRCLERELELNAPLALGLYRDVVAIANTLEGEFTIEPTAGEEGVVDWVLRMARVPVADLLDQRATDGRLDPAMSAALGDMVADLHASLPSVTGWDGPGALARLIVGNAESARVAGLPAAQIERWRVGCETRLEQSRAWLNARAAAGFVRRAHGDLHLGNICLWQGKLVPFDALEFDEVLATIDTAYDLAFLLMDLDRRVSRSTANRVMNRYVARTGDAALTGGLPLLLSLRAMVRAHVRQSAGLAGEAEGYLHAALDYLADGKRVVLAVGGLPGTGKSTVARALAPDLGRAPGALVIRSDEVRKRLHHVQPEQRLPAEAYSEAANAQTNAAVLEAVMLAASGGQAVIADATFVDPAQREAIEAACAAADVAFRGMWLEAPLDVLVERVRARRDDASDATEAVLRRAAERGVGELKWKRVANG